MYKLCVLLLIFFLYQFILNTVCLISPFFQFRDDNKKLHPCLVDFQSLPEPEKNYNLAMSGETLKLVKHWGFICLLLYG